MLIFLKLRLYNREFYSTVRDYNTWQVGTIPRKKSYEYVPKKTLPRPSRQPREGIYLMVPVSSKEKTESHISSQSDHCDESPDETYEDLNIGDENNICEVKQQKVCQSLILIHLNFIA